MTASVLASSSRRRIIKKIDFLYKILSFFIYPLQQYCLFIFAPLTLILITKLLFLPHKFQLILRKLKTCNQTNRPRLLKSILKEETKKRNTRKHTTTTVAQVTIKSFLLFCRILSWSAAPRTRLIARIQKLKKRSSRCSFARRPTTFVKYSTQA